MFWNGVLCAGAACVCLDGVASSLRRVAVTPARCTDSARWFFIHSWINLVVVWYGFGDLCLTLQGDGARPWEHGSWLYGWVMAAHLYHSVCFRLTPSDVIHHTSTALISTPIIVNGIASAECVGGLWFLSGFPGMLDYAALWAVKMGWVESKTEKRLYVGISLWIRSPGCVAISVLALSNMPLSLSPYTLAVVFVSVVTFTNGQGYLWLTLRDYYSK